MILKNNELEKKELLINRVRLETQLEELLEHLLEEMNGQLIVDMPLMMLCMLKIKELKKVLKEMVQFFVLELQDIVFLMHKFYKILKISSLTNYFYEIQFSVFGTGFSVLVPVSHKFNSLYSNPDSLKKKN